MNKNIIQINLGEINNSCFVVMPFSPFFQTQYSQVIQEALKDLNLECIRGDEIYSKQRIMDDIWDSIKKCRLVIAELTGRNPNVLYEIGLAHAIGKPIIILTRNPDDVPFDLKDLRYLFYDINDPFWGENLKKGIKNLVQKVIESPSIGGYLEGISFPKEIEYPEITLKKNVTKEKIIFPQVSGTWIGQHKDSMGDINSVTLNISQHEDELYATAINSYPNQGEQTIVQQIMNGSIVNNNIKLVGVNYTYVERGKSNNYSLDTYLLNYDNERDILSGTMLDVAGHADAFELKRLNGS